MYNAIYALFQCLQYVFGIAVDFLYMFFDAFSTPKAFNDKFGSERLIASRLNKGFAISSNRRISRKLSYRNLLITAVTGAGKTTKLLLPTLYSLRDCSLIVNDPSRELFLLSSGELSKHFTIKTLNFSDSTVSSGFNILSRIVKPNDVNKIAHLITATTLDRGHSDPFWSLSVKTLLQILIRLVLHQPAEHRNMANVLHLLHVFSATPNKIDPLIAHTNDEKLILDYTSLLSTPDKTLQNIVASAKAALNIFEAPEVAKVTSHDSIDFNELREKPTLLFLHLSIGDLKFLTCLVSIFFEQFYAHMLEQLPKKSDLDCFCLIDEASSLYIPMLSIACANGRKARIGNTLVIQSKNQLRTFYKEQAQTICANCVTHIILGGQTALDELREIEALSGKCVYRDDKGAERVKPLITANEIRQLPNYRSLIISGNHPIIKGRVTSYWWNLTYRRYAKVPPVSLRGDVPETAIPLLSV